MTPIRISGWPKTARRRRRRSGRTPSPARSRRRGRTRGPPRSAACGSRAARSQRAKLPRDREADRASRSAISLMSAPAANARSPAPVMTIARTRVVGVERLAAPRRAGASSSKSSALRTSGRSSVTSATPGTSPSGPSMGRSTRTSGGHRLGRALRAGAAPWAGVAPLPPAVVAGFAAAGSAAVVRDAAVAAFAAWPVAVVDDSPVVVRLVMLPNLPPALRVASAGATGSRGTAGSRRPRR